MRARIAVLIVLAIIALASLAVLPPIPQDRHYHAFADQQTLWGVPNFWNVASNLPFLFVAVWGTRAFRNRKAFLQNWERIAFGILLGGAALVAVGSAWYHLNPNNGTLVLDRLPMTVVFMSLLAAITGERVSMRAGQLLLWPLLAAGIASVVYWNYSGDLRPYAIAQFYPVLAIPVMLLLFPPRYSGSRGTWLMIGCYAVAKLLELFDARIGRVIAMGGHPWKHVMAALALFFYVDAVRRREFTPPPTPSSARSTAGSSALLRSTAAR